MKRYLMLGLLAIMLAVPAMGQDIFQNSGFRLGHVAQSTNDIYGLIPADGFLVQVTSVTSTTVFYVEALQLRPGAGTTLSQLDSLLIGHFKLRGVSCFTTANENADKAITAFVQKSGKVTSAAWGTALKAGDILAVIPVSSVGEPLSITITGKKATSAGTTLATATGSVFIRSIQMKKLTSNETSVSTFTLTSTDTQALNLLLRKLNGDPATYTLFTTNTSYVFPVNWILTDGKVLKLASDVNGESTNGYYVTIDCYALTPNASIQ
jgi:hypothetical protein